MKVILRNSRTPETNEADLMAIIAAMPIGAQRVVELCDRFGVEMYLDACDALFARTREAMRRDHSPLHPGGAGQLHGRR